MIRIAAPPMPVKISKSILRVIMALLDTIVKWYHLRMTLLIFLLILSVLVLVHELGHFLMAKRAGILVEEFGFGLPPRLWGKKIGETIYSINWLPIGGFVKLYGEDHPELENPVRTFFGQNKLVRFSVLIAGVVMNFLLGVVVFSIIYSRLGIPTQTETVRVMDVVADSPASAAGIKSGEVVMAVGNEAIKSTDRFIEVIDANRGKEVEITLGDGNKGKYGRIVKVMPREHPPEGEGALGVAISSIEMQQFPWWQMPVRGAVVGVKEAFAWGVTIGSGLAHMVSRWVVEGRPPADVAGPVGIFQLTGGVAQAGVLAVLQFMGVLSINLAVLNLLPLPALDGGRLAFLAVETVTRRRLRPGVEKLIHAAGMIALLGLMAVVTVNDLVRLTGVGSLWGFVERVWPF